MSTLASQRSECISQSFMHESEYSFLGNQVRAIRFLEQLNEKDEARKTCLIYVFN